MRPWFISTRGGRLAGGSDVWELERAGLIASDIDYDVVGTWIYYVHEFHRRSLFKDCHRLPHSSLNTWHAGEFKSTSYLNDEIGDRVVTREAMAEIVHDRVSRDFDALMDGVPEVSIGLSGGFDSRYLAALAVRKPGLKVSAHVVANDETEVTIARHMAGALELKLDVIATDGTQWNMFDQPYGFGGEGFPMTRQVCRLIAERRPGVPMINGFLGDAVIRSSGIDGSTRPIVKLKMILPTFCSASTTRRRIGWTCSMDGCLPGGGKGHCALAGLGGSRASAGKAVHLSRTVQPARAIHRQQLSSASGLVRSDHAALHAGPDRPALPP